MLVIPTYPIRQDLTVGSRKQINALFCLCRAHKWRAPGAALPWDVAGAAALKGCSEIKAVADKEARLK